MVATGASPYAIRDVSRWDDHRAFKGGTCPNKVTEPGGGACVSATGQSRWEIHTQSQGLNFSPFVSDRGVPWWCSGRARAPGNNAQSVSQVHEATSSTMGCSDSYLPEKLLTRSLAMWFTRGALPSTRRGGGEASVTI